MQVHLQTQQQVQKGLVGMTGQVIKNHGILALYNGLSASLCRQVKIGWVACVRVRGGEVAQLWPQPLTSIQLTYSTTRFGVYEVLKGKLLPSDGGKHGIINLASRTEHKLFFLFAGGLPFYQKVLLGASGGYYGLQLCTWLSYFNLTGFLGVFVGNPFDVVNIR